MMQAATFQSSPPMSAGHPNEFDLRRIERGLQDRLRYRYVNPTIIGIDGGYRIQAPCCSRNVDPDGGIIDVALMLYDGPGRQWRLFSKDHERQSWELHATFPRIKELLDHINADPRRAFWQ